MRNVVSFPQQTTPLASVSRPKTRCGLELRHLASRREGLAFAHPLVISDQNISKQRITTTLQVRKKKNVNQPKKQMKGAHTWLDNPLLYPAHIPHSSDTHLHIKRPSRRPHHWPPKLPPTTHSRRHPPQLSRPVNPVLRGVISSTNKQIKIYT